MLLRLFTGRIVVIPVDLNGLLLAICMCPGIHNMMWCYDFCMTHSRGDGGGDDGGTYDSLDTIVIFLQVVFDRDTLPNQPVLLQLIHNNLCWGKQFYQ